MSLNLSFFRSFFKTREELESEQILLLAENLVKWYKQAASYKTDLSPILLDEDSANELSKLGYERTSILFAFNKRPTLILSAAILLYENFDKALLRYLIAEVPHDRLPFHDKISEVTSRSESHINTPVELLCVEAAAMRTQALKFLVEHLSFDQLKPQIKSPKTVLNAILIANHFNLLACPNAMEMLFSDREFVAAFNHRYASPSKHGLNLMAYAARSALKGESFLLQFLISKPEILNRLILFSTKTADPKINDYYDILDNALKLAYKGFPQLMSLFLESGGYVHFHESGGSFPGDFHELMTYELAFCTLSDSLTEDVKIQCRSFLVTIHKAHWLESVIPLHLYIAQGDTVRVKQMIETSPNKKELINTCFNQHSPLALSIRFKKMEVMSLLLMHGADLSSSSEDAAILSKVASINLLKRILAHTTVSKPAILRQVLEKGSRNYIKAVYELNRDYKRFSCAVKGLSVLPSEVIGKILAPIFDYKTEARLGEDAKYILSAWRHFKLHGNLKGYVMLKASPSTSNTANIP